jgi:hypothetical protein
MVTLRVQAQVAAAAAVVSKQHGRTADNSSTEWQRMRATLVT